MSHKRTVPRICRYCGSDFLTFADAPARGRGIYCSRSCRAKDRTGDQSPNWTGGKSRSRGYVIATLPSGRRFEHRIVMEQALGRPLRREEVVHHINGIKDDNRPENLQVISQPEHMAMHHAVRSASRWATHYDRCQSCGTTERKHFGHGLCKRCDQRERRKKP